MYEKCLFLTETHIFQKGMLLFKKKKAPAASLKRSKHGLGTPKTRLFKKSCLERKEKTPAALNDSYTWLGVPNTYTNVININSYWIINNYYHYH